MLNAASFSRRVMHVFFPERCACCSRVILPEKGICDTCRAALPRIGRDCCPACGQKKPKCHCKPRVKLAPCIAPFFYKDGIRQGIHTLKFEGLTHGVNYFAEQMAQEVTDRYGSGFDGVVYVPSTRKKQRRRGYNPARWLAGGMAKKLNIPLLDGALTRLYETNDQHVSPLPLRKANVFGVFDADPALVAGKHLLLVDDIITTGATMDECAKMLWLSDCAEVCCIALASTPAPEESH